MNTAFVARYSSTGTASTDTWDRGDGPAQDASQHGCNVLTLQVTTAAVATGPVPPTRNGNALPISRFGALDIAGGAVLT